MTRKFENVPVEEDTTVLLQFETRMSDYDALYQKWIWSGITAESLIFAESDLSPMDDSELEKLARTAPLVKPGEITITRNRNGFAFINFSFEAIDE